jgi:hypothetical protein
MINRIKAAFKSLDLARFLFDCSHELVQTNVAFEPTDRGNLFSVLQLCSIYGNAEHGGIAEVVKRLAGHQYPSDLGATPDSELSLKFSAGL